MWRCWWLSRWESSQSGLLKARDLRCDFALDFIPADAPRKRAFEKFAICAGKTSCFIDKGRQRPPAADTACSSTSAKCRPTSSAGKSARQRDGLLKRTPGHQQRGTRHDSILKRPHDPAVDSGRQSPIICVDNQLFQDAETRSAPISRRIFIRKATSSRIILKSRPGWPEWRCRDFGENNLRQIARS